jgi:hypothetical protein
MCEYNNEDVGRRNDIDARDLLYRRQQSCIITTMLVIESIILRMKAIVGCDG